jgi:hypothetical protein
MGKKRESGFRIIFVMLIPTETWGLSLYCASQGAKRSMCSENLQIQWMNACNQEGVQGSRLRKARKNSLLFHIHECLKFCFIVVGLEKQCCNLLGAFLLTT